MSRASALLALCLMIAGCCNEGKGEAVKQAIHRPSLPSVERRVEQACGPGSAPLSATAIEEPAFPSKGVSDNQEDLDASRTDYILVICNDGVKRVELNPPERSP